MNNDVVKMPLHFSFNPSNNDEWLESLQDYAKDFPALLGIFFMGIKGKACVEERKDGAEFVKGAIHWKCSLSTAWSRSQTRISMGSGYKGRIPGVIDVLSFLARDKEMFSNYKNPEDLILEGLIKASEPDCYNKAQVLLKNLRKSSDVLFKISGPFSGIESVNEVLMIAKNLCEGNPQLLDPSEGRPFGLSELACACGDISTLNSMIQRGISLERLKACVNIAEIFEHDELALSVSALYERDMLDKVVKVDKVVKKEFNKTKSL